MNIVKIFLASSIVEFEQERDKLAARIRGLNNHQYDIDFRLDICEDYSKAMTQGRKQEDFNKLVRECDFFFSLIGANVGEATLEEIDVAIKQFRKSGSALFPKIVVFFKDLSEVSGEVIRLKERVRGVMGHYPPKFAHISEVTRDILMELIDGGAFFNPAALEAGRVEHAQLLARIAENRKKIAALGEPTDENEAELMLLYRENVELSRAALSDWETLYDYAVFLHKRCYDAKAIETGAELEARYTAEDEPDDRAALQNLLGDCCAALGRHEDAETRYRAALEIYRPLAEAEPDDYSPDLAETCVKLAEIFVKTYRYEGAERLYREALACYLRDWEEYVLEIGQICHALRGFVGKARDAEALILQEAEEAFLAYWADETKDKPETAQDSVSQWLDAFPCPDTAAELIKQAEAQAQELICKPDAYEQMLALIHSYQVHSSCVHCERCRVEMRAREFTQDKPNKYERVLATICHYMAVSLDDHNQKEFAEIIVRKALKMRRKLQEDEYIAMSCNNLALILCDTERFYEAEKYHREQIEIWQRLATKATATYDPELTMSYNNLAKLLGDMGRYEEAVKYCRESLEISRRLVQQDLTQFEPELAISCGSLAGVLCDIKRYGEAELHYREALKIQRKLARQDPTEFEPDLASFCNRLANLLRKIGRHEEEEYFRREALEIYRKLAKQDPTRFEPYLGLSCHNYGVLLISKRNFTSAKAHFEEAIALLEKYPRYGRSLDNAIRARNICQQRIWQGRGT